MAAKGQEPATRPADRRRMGSLLQRQDNRHRRLRLYAEFGHPLPADPSSASTCRLTCNSLKSRAPPSLPRSRRAKCNWALSTSHSSPQGIRSGIWGEPVYNVPAELGPYAWATVNVRADTIEKQPQLLGRFVRALVKGLKATYSDPAAAVAIAQQEFPDGGGRGIWPRPCSAVWPIESGARMVSSIRRPGRWRKTLSAAPVCSNRMCPTPI